MSMLNVGSGKTDWVTPRYEIRELIDTGTFAEVYRAFDTTYGVEVAVKVYLKPVNARDTDERAKREIGMLKKLKGSEFFPDRPANLVQHFKQQRHHVLVMELGEYSWQEEESQDGPALPRRRSRKEILPLDQVIPQLGSSTQPQRHRPEFWNGTHLAEWVVDLSEAVRLMHDRGVLHLDLKPSNVLLKRGPDRQRSVPFIIDFNTSLPPGAERFEGATADYRAPEVVHTKASRTKPAIADDLYALALILTEIHFGLGSHKRARDPGLKPHTYIPYPVDALRKVLLRALDSEPKKRFATASEFKKAVAESLAAPKGLSVEEMAHIRKEAQQIRENIEEIFTGWLSLYVSKNLRDEVASLFSNLSAEATDSLDLRNRLLALGEKAVPAIFEEGYKLDIASPHFPVVVDALGEFGCREAVRVNNQPNAFPPDRAMRSLDDYRLSSNYAVRRLCRELCRKLKVFPNGQREILEEEPDIFLPDERDEVVELCLDCGTTEADFRALMLYMCDKFCTNPRAYFDLRRRVAGRLAGMPVKDKTRLLVEWAVNHLWEGLPGYQKADTAEREELARGVFQLFGDAFASLGQEALEALQTNRVPDRSGREQSRALWRTFATKLAQTFPAAREWIFALKSSPPGVNYKSLEQVREKVSSGVSGTDPEDSAKIFREYLKFGQLSLLNRLIWSPRLGEILNLAAAAMDANPGGALRVLALLRGCESKLRSQVLSIAFNHYETFAAVGYRDLIRVICQAWCPHEWRAKAEQHLRTDLEIPSRQELALEWLDRLLEED
jgi:serine/threonine protein kinase